jgi:Putative adhesin
MSGGTTMTYMSETGGSVTGGYPTGAWRPSGPLRMTPGRWVALAVTVPVALALIGWTGFSVVASLARGSYPFSYSVPVHNGQVSVNVLGGDVALREVSGSGTARLSGTVQYGLVRPGINENTTPTGTDVGVDCGGVSTGNCGMNATLNVPPQTSVTLSSNGGDIDASGFTSGMTLSAAGGNMNANNLSGHLVLDTGGGDLTGGTLTGTIQISTEGGNVNAGNLKGPMRLDTGGGDLTGNGFTGDLQIFSEGGNIDANAVVSQQVSIASGGGDVTVDLSQPPARLTITADGGNVSVILPPGDTKYAISTPDTQGGNVNFPSTLTSPTSPHVLTIDSGGGDITISKAG